MLEPASISDFIFSQLSYELGANNDKIWLSSV